MAVSFQSCWMNFISSPRVEVRRWPASSPPSKKHKATKPQRQVCIFRNRNIIQKQSMECILCKLDEVYIIIII